MLLLVFTFASGLAASGLAAGFIPSSELLRTTGYGIHTLLRWTVQPLGRLFGFVYTLDDGGDATMLAAFAPVGGQLQHTTFVAGVPLPLPINRLCDMRDALLTCGKPCATAARSMPSVTWRSDGLLDAGGQPVFLRPQRPGALHRG